MEKRLRYDMEIPKDIVYMWEALKKEGYKLYVVGGAVRDAYMGLRPKDYDVATDALPDDVERIMQGAGLRTLPTGKAFGVINVFTTFGEYEVATFREDIGSGRRPESVVFTTIEGDVKRRDLTMNALFYDLDSGEIVDLVGGLEDIDNRVIRTVGSATERFNEDRLRILRAIRFAGRFGSELDLDIQTALETDSSLEGISGERIRDEFIKGIKSAFSVRHYLNMLHDYELFDWIFPSAQVDARLIECSDPIILIAILLHKVPEKELPKLLNSLKYSIDETRAIVFLNSVFFLTLMNSYVLKKQQKNSGLKDAQIREFGRLMGVNGIVLDAFLDFELSVSGANLIEQGIPAGPELGIMIERLETANFFKMVK